MVIPSRELLFRATYCAYTLLRRFANRGLNRYKQTKKVIWVAFRFSSKIVLIGSRSLIGISLTSRIYHQSSAQISLKAA